MVEFWGIFVVLSACLAFQLADSYPRDVYMHSNVVSASEELQHLTNSKSDSKELNDALYQVDINELSNSSSNETQTNVLEEHSPNQDNSDSLAVLKAPLDLSVRRDRLHQFAYDGMRQYINDYVRLSRKAINELLTELQALPEKSDAIKQNITLISGAWEKIKNVDLDVESSEEDDLYEAVDVIADLNDDLDDPNTDAPVLEKALEKVGWMYMRYMLGDKMNSLIEEFGEEFDAFVATLTHEERQVEAELVRLHKLYTEGDTDTKWGLFDEIFSYFSQ